MATTDRVPDALAEGSSSAARTVARVGRAGSVAVSAARRAPFTAAVVAAMLALGLATGSFWSPLAERPVAGQLAYGLPAFAEGHWWTVVTGSLLAGHPALYPLTLVLFAVAVGWCELRIGTRRTAVVCVAGQVAAVALTALLVGALAATPWAWADGLAADLDTGFSAGMFAVLAATSATLRAPWRLRLRLVMVGYVVVGLLYLAQLADLEHALALVLVLPFARAITGAAAPARGSGLGRREWRLVAATGLVLLAAIRVTTWLVPVVGPLGATGSDSTAVETLVSAAISLLLAEGLRRGRRPAWVLALVLGVFYALLGLLVVAAVIYARLTGQLDQLELVGLAVFVPNAVLWSAELTWLVAGRRAFGVPSRRRARRARDGARVVGPEQARAELREHGGSTLSWMTTWPENRYLAHRAGYTAYRVHAGVAVALGDPIVPAPDRAAALAEFRATAERAGWVPCLFSSTAELADTAGSAGWRTLQVAEDTVVELGGLEFTGKAWQNVRSAFNRAGKAGISHRLVRLADEPRPVLAQVRAISEEWVGDKGLPEMGFTLGGVEQALDPEVRTGLAIDAEGTVHGVTSWLPVYGPGGQVHGWTLDLMRRRTDGFRAVVEYLIASACRDFQAEGARMLSLSGAPLARTGDGSAEALDRLLDRLGALLEPYYGFRSLHAFKAKFQPRYEPMYLVYRDEADLPRVGVGIARAYLPDAGARQLLALTRR